MTVKNFCPVCSAPTKIGITRTYVIAGHAYTLTFADHSHPRAAVEAAHNLVREAARATAKDTNGGPAPR